MANLFNNPSHRANIGYNGFDMSHLLKFSSTVGELLPVYYDVLNPGDKLTIGTELKSRTMDLSTAAMVHINQDIDWFFVPLTQIYSLFGDWRYGIDDIKSSIFNKTYVGVQMPHMSPSEFLSKLQTMSAVTDPYFNNVQISGTTVRLLESLGIPCGRILQGTIQQGQGVVVNTLAFCPLLLCAYQKIYADFYRLADREAPDAQSYNLDAWYDSSAMTASDTPDSMFQLRYRPRNKDFFTNIFTSPLMNLVGVGAFPNQNAEGAQSLANSFNNWLSSLIATPLNESNFASQGSPTTVSVAGNGGGSINVTPSQIRTAFAVQKMLEVTRRAGKHYDKQVLAHFGVEVPTGIAGEVTFIGRHSSDIKIGDVIATANSEVKLPNKTDSVYSTLGQVGGKGYGYGKNGGLKFTAPCEGILMGIYSSYNDVDYYDIGWDKLNGLIERSDFFTPEFDNLGMQPLFSYQAIYSPWTTGYASRRGWQYRYSELKCKFNRVRGALGRGRGLTDWTTGTYQSNANLENFLVSPKSLDPIMLFNYQFDGHVTPSTGTGVQDATLYAYDPLIHQLYFDVKKASKMSTYGLEQL